MIAAFERHGRDVVEALADRCLLVYDVAEAWEPLCHHLDTEVPSVPVPPHDRPKLVQSLLGVPGEPGVTSSAPPT